MPSPTLTPPLSTPTANPPDRVSPLRDVLGQLRRLVERLDAQAYNHKPVTTYAGSLGGHVRHCLDHVAALLAGTADKNGVVDYEARQRGGDIETDPAAALELMRRLDADLAALQPDEPRQRELTAVLMLSPHEPTLHAPSCLDRELAFVLNHTIHHNAMIGGMAKALGVDVPDDFGVAPGTLRHEQQRADG